MATSKTPHSLRRRRFQARIIRYRRPLALCFAVIAALSLARIAQPPEPQTLTTVVAARDLIAGEILDDSDLEVREIVDSTLWEGTFSDPRFVVGESTAHALSKDQPIDAHSLVGPSLLDGLPFTMRAMVVTISPSAQRIISVGDHIDLMTGAISNVGLIDTPTVAVSEVIANDVTVLATSGSAQSGLLNSSGSSTSTITVATTSEQSMRIARYASTELVIALRNVSS